MKHSKLRVGVTGFGGLGNPEPGTAVAETLRKGLPGGVEIHALVPDSTMTGAWLPGVADLLHLVPPSGPEETLCRLTEIHKEYEFDAIIPCRTAELPSFAIWADRLGQLGIETMLPSLAAIERTTKVNLPRLAHSQDWPAPKTIYIGDLADIRLHAEQFGFPLMVKGSAMGAIRAENTRQAQDAAQRLFQFGGGGVLLQEILAGDQIGVGAVVARNGAVIASVSMQKLGLDSDGQAVLGAVIDDPQIEEQARRVIDGLNWCGPIDLEFIRSYRSDTPYLVQVKARFPSWVSLTHIAGCNLPAIMLNELAGGPRARRFNPRPGTMFVRHVRETTVPLQTMRGLERHGLARAPRRRKKSTRISAPGETQGMRIAITGLGSLDVVNPGLGAAAALKRSPGVSRVLGFGYGTYESGMYDRQAFDAVYRLPVQGSAEVLLDRLLEINRASPFDVILPCLDGEIPRFIQIETELRTAGIRTLLPSQAAFDRRTKKELFSGKIKRAWGAFEIPESVLVQSPKDLRKALKELGVPVVLKGPISGAIPAHSLAEAESALRLLLAQGINEVIVQPMYAGDHLAISTVCGRDFQAVRPVTIKKLVTCQRGSTWAAISMPQPNLEIDFARFLAEIQWCGPVEGEFIRDWRQETFHLIEVNPRFTAWNYFAAALGVNQAFDAACLALGAPVSADPGTRGSGDIFVRSCEDIPASILDFASVAAKGRLENVS